MSMDRDEQIRLQAYTLWEQSGCPHGLDLQFWLDAESQLMNAGQFQRENSDHDHVKVSHVPHKEEK